MVYDQEAAEVNYSPPMQATPQQKALALHHNLAVPEHEALFARRMADVMSRLCQAADRKGCLAMAAAQAPRGSPVLAAVSAAAAQAAAAAAAANPAGNAAAPTIMDPATGQMPSAGSPVRAWNTALHMLHPLSDGLTPCKAACQGISHFITYDANVAFHLPDMHNAFKLLHCFHYSPN